MISSSRKFQNSSEFLKLFYLSLLQKVPFEQRETANHTSWVEITLLISKIATGCWHLTGVVGLLWFCVKADSSSSAATMVTPGYSFILGLERCYTCQLSTGQNIQKSDCYSCSVQCRVNGPERQETSDNSIWFCAILSLKGLWGILSSLRRIVICGCEYVVAFCVHVT